MHGAFLVSKPVQKQCKIIFGVSVNFVCHFNKNIEILLVGRKNLREFWEKEKPPPTRETIGEKSVLLGKCLGKHILPCGNCRGIAPFR